VTAPSGLTRWQARDGSTYETREEAAAAVPWGEAMYSPYRSRPRQPPGMPVFEAFALLALGLLGVSGIVYAITGRLQLNGWLWWIAPFGWYMMLGMGLQGAVSIYARLTGHQKRYELEKKMETWWLEILKWPLTIIWWMIKITFWIIAASGLLYLPYMLLSGLSKGTIVIALLLFGILMALLQRQDRRS